MRKAVIGLAGLLLLSACQTALEYEPKMHHVKMPDDTYIIYEHPKRDRLMTAPSLARSFGEGFVGGATLGIVRPTTPEQRHEAAARKYLDTTGRTNCRITRGYLLIDPQYEFFFTCS